VPAKILLERVYGSNVARIVEATATGPASDVDVAAGTAVDIVLTATDGDISGAGVAMIESIGGLPDGLAIAGVSISLAQGSATVTIRVYNPTSSTVTVTAKSVTAKIVVIG